MKKRFSEEQIIGFLREADAGLAVESVQGRMRFSGDAANTPSAASPIANMISGKYEKSRSQAVIGVR